MPVADGGRLKIRQVAAELGAGVMPVRAALQRLACAGAVNNAMRPTTLDDPRKAYNSFAAAWATSLLNLTCASRRPLPMDATRPGAGFFGCNPE